MTLLRVVAAPSRRSEFERLFELLAEHFAVRSRALSFTTVGDLAPGSGAEQFVHLFTDHGDLRARLWADHLSAAGGRVGLHLDGQSATSLDRIMASWRPFLSFVTHPASVSLDLQALADVPAYGFDFAHLERVAVDGAEATTRKTKEARIDRRVSLVWKTPAAATSESFGRVEAACVSLRVAGYEPRLVVLDAQFLSPQALRMLARAPVTLETPRSSLEAGARALTYGHAVLLDREAEGAFADEALRRCQLIAIDAEASDRWNGVAHPDVRGFIAALDAGEFLSVTGRTNAETGRVARAAAREAHGFAAFLDRLATPVVTTPRSLLLVDDETAPDLPALARSLGVLTVGGPFAPKSKHDVRIAFEADGPTAHLSERAMRRLDGGMKAVTRPVEEGGGRLALALTPDIEAALRTALGSDLSRAMRDALRGPLTRFATAGLAWLFPERPVERGGSLEERHALQLAPGFAGRVAIRPSLHVAWLIQKQDLASASTRYRAFYMALALAGPTVRHSFHTKPEAIAKSLKTTDVVVIVKRLDPALIELVSAVRSQNKTVLLDLCDDLLAPFYRRGGDALNQMVFRAIAPLLDGVLTPSTAMARNVRERSRGMGLRPPRTFVMPDAAETPEAFEAAGVLARSEAQNATLVPVAQHFLLAQAEPKVASRANPMRVVWFGNFGGPHSNFGLASVLEAVPALRAVNADIPLELVVISNSRERFDALLAPLDIPCVWTPWNEKTVHFELCRADVALLTNGDDEFSKLKSANRALLALSLGLPVVASDTEAFRQLRPAIVVGDFEGGLRRFLGPGREHECARAHERAQPVLRRYGLERLGRSWRRLLTRTAMRASRATDAGPARVLIFLESAARCADAEVAIALCRACGVVPMVTLAPAAARASEIRELLIEQSIIPNIFIGAEGEPVDRRWLRGADTLLLEREKSPSSVNLGGWGRAAGTEVLLLSQARIARALAGSDRAPQPKAAPPFAGAAFEAFVSAAQGAAAAHAGHDRARRQAAGS